MKRLLTDEERQWHRQIRKELFDHSLPNEEIDRQCIVAALDRGIAEGEKRERERVLREMDTVLIQNDSVGREESLRKLLKKILKDLNRDGQIGRVTRARIEVELED